LNDNLIATVDEEGAVFLNTITHESIEIFTKLRQYYYAQSIHIKKLTSSKFVLVTDDWIEIWNFDGKYEIGLRASTYVSGIHVLSETHFVMNSLENFQILNYETQTRALILFKLKFKVFSLRVSVCGTR
jgi:hypothetical protein